MIASSSITDTSQQIERHPSDATDARELADLRLFLSTDDCMVIPDYSFEDRWLAQARVGKHYVRAIGPTRIEAMRRAASMLRGLVP